MFKFLKKLWYIAHHYDSDLTSLRAQVEQAYRLIKERTTVHMDIHTRSPSQVILIGQYRNRDYVQAFPVNVQDFEELRALLKRMEARVGRLDVPPAYFEAVAYLKNKE